MNFRSYHNVEKLIEGCCQEIQSSIDLEKGPLVKVGMFKTNEGDHLLIAIHHLVIDGVSWRILLRISPKDTIRHCVERKSSFSIRPTHLKTGVATWRNR